MNRDSEVSGSKTGGNEMNYVLLEGIVADEPGLLQRGELLQNPSRPSDTFSVEMLNI